MYPRWYQANGGFAMNKKYVVRLTAQEREQIEKLLRRGRAHARKLLYGRIVLKADADGPDPWTDERIADALEVSTATVARERRRYCEEGLEIALMCPGSQGCPEERGSGRTLRSAPDRACVLGSSGGEGTLELETSTRSPTIPCDRSSVSRRDPASCSLR